MKRLLFVLLSVSLFPMFGFSADPLPVGADAPTLTVPTDTGESLDLAKVYAEGPTLVYFYPKAFTPGCTKQACNLRDNFDAVQEAGITVIGVSGDTVAKQADFREEYALPFTLVADHEGTLGEAFGVGRMLGLAFKRQSFLVVDGKIAWRDLSASPASQSRDAIDALASLKKD